MISQDLSMLIKVKKRLKAALGDPKDLRNIDYGVKASGLNIALGVIRTMEKETRADTKMMPVVTHGFD